MRLSCVVFVYNGDALSVPPKVQLHLGSTLKAENIKEGDDVYFECKVRANPEHHKITWRHNVSPSHPRNFTPVKLSPSPTIIAIIKYKGNGRRNLRYAKPRT